MTQVEIHKRRSKVTKYLINGLDTEKIVDKMAEEYDFSREQTLKEIRAVKDYVVKKLDLSNEFEFKKAVLRYDDLYRRSLKKKDFGECRRNNTELTKLLDLGGANTMNLKTPFAEQWKLPKELEELAKRGTNEHSKPD